MTPAIVSPDRNPVLDDDGTHIGIARFVLIGGALHQLFWPCDGVSGAEWREVPVLDLPEPVNP